MKKTGFTLAEVLITLGIIGVVAAITIPTLVSNYKQRAWNTAATVFERKLEESLKAMNTQQTLAGYRNTADFVSELSKHFKITRVCKNDDLLTCFEDKVWWGAGDADPEEVDMAEIKTASNFGQEDWDTEIIGVQFANGTTGLVAYNPNCKQNPYSNQITGTSCLALLYDTDGFKSPNTSGKDLRGINVNSLGGKNCAFELQGLCFGAPFKPSPITEAECEAEEDKLGLPICHDGSYWAGAVKACGGVNKMPTRSQLEYIVDALYKNPDGSMAGNRNNELAAAWGFPEDFAVWTSEVTDFSITSAYDFYFFQSYVNRGSSDMSMDYDYAICIY